MSTSLAMEYPQGIEIDTGDWVDAVTFTTNGEYLVSGGLEGVQVWRMKDGERVATMRVEDVWSVGASKDGKFIAAGSIWGDVWVWDAMTHEQVFAHKFADTGICDIDFSVTDSKKLVLADGIHCTATVLDLVARKKVHTFDHREQWVYAAKYSPQGDRIATACNKYVRVWDSDDGRLLVVVDEPRPWRGLFWLENHLFVHSDACKIKKINASTGSTVSEWSVPHSDGSRIALSPLGQLIAYSTKDNVTLWDSSTHTQLGLISRGSGGLPIAFSPDGQLAVVTQGSKIVINNIFFIIEPGIRIEAGPLHAWKNGQLTKAEGLLTATARSKDSAHHVLASRALVRARLQQWGAALADAEESLEIQPSIFGYIAKCVTLVGKQGAHAACRISDIASLLFRSDDLAVLLLVKIVALFMAGEHEDAMSRVDDLITARPLDTTLYVVQAYMLFLRGNLYLESGDYTHAISLFEDAQFKLGSRTKLPPLIVSLISGWEFNDLAITIQQRLCEALFAAGRTKAAGESVLRIVVGDVNMSESIKTWVSEFLQRCISAPEEDCSLSSASTGRNNATHSITPLLREWTKLRHSSGSWKDALASATGLMLPRVTIYRAMCEHLEITGHLIDAVGCFHQMYSELPQETVMEQVNWTREFESRCSGKLANLGDIAMSSQEYDEAILQYTTALSLNPPTLQELLSKRSRAHTGKGEWEDALNDANEMIRLDLSSPLGYERRHAALHGLGRHDDATDTFETMLLKMSISLDPLIQERFRHYIKTKEAINTTIEDTIRDIPLVLIDTIRGRLCDKSEQASAFETTPTFMELIFSTTTYPDHAHIEHEVGKYFRYATFSHKWEDKEPLFEKVIRIVVYELEASPTHEKLKMFCKIVREAGFNWAWSDTCCINKGDHFVLQEALVSMFKWYERSAMTIIFLRGVTRLALPGALMRSIWNMRAWTLQEYHASKVVRIYTEDWTPYLGLEIYNHKMSPEVISEMEAATGISAQALMALRPGLDDIREKLRLASTRQTTRVEDAAYSLLGIFSMTLPITYGEGDKALGRLLSQLLASSGDMSILAWTGRSGSFNSCLPSSITVFRELPTSHIPPAVSDAEMRSITVGVRSLDPTMLVMLYDRVNELPVPAFSGLRMKLPCLAFKLGPLSVSRSGLEFVSRAQTNILGVVELRTGEDISSLGPLYLVHPWIDYLLDRQPLGSAPETSTDENVDDDLSALSELLSLPGASNIASATGQTRTARLLGRFGRPFGGRSISSVQDATPPLLTSSDGQAVPDTASLLPPSTISPLKKQTRVLQFIARLRQPFGPLLLAGTRRNIDEYRRVATESLIRVQVKEITPDILDKLIDSVKLLDVL